MRDSVDQKSSCSRHQCKSIQNFLDKYLRLREVSSDMHSTCPLLADVDQLPIIILSIAMKLRSEIML